MMYSVIVLAIIIGAVSSTYVSPQEWQNYKNQYHKNYNTSMNNKRRIYYAINKNRIRIHNLRFDRQQISYKLGINELTDLSDFEYNKMMGYRFQDTVYERPSTTAPPPTQPPPFPSVPHQNWTGVGAVTPVKNQGTLCNSAWAYAANAALETTTYLKNRILPNLSEQELIDCAGLVGACKGGQSPQAAYNYIKLTLFINSANGYPKNPTGQKGQCTPKNTDYGATLADFVQIPDRDDGQVKSIVSYNGPVVVAYNPFSFEFRSYKWGIFVPPRSFRQDFTKYYMAVVGYDTDPLTNKPFWILKNSMGSDWGESGFIKIEMSASNPIARSAIYPIV